jgi:hypothetical protein
MRTPGQANPEHPAFFRFHTQHDAHLQAAVGDTVKRVILHLYVTAPGTIRAHFRATKCSHFAMPGARPTFLTDAATSIA